MLVPIKHLQNVTKGNCSWCVEAEDEENCIKDKMTAPKGRRHPEYRRIM